MRHYIPLAPKLQLLGATIVGLAFLNALPPAFAKLKGDPALLRQAAQLHKANREKIVTWSGRVLVSDREELEGQEISRAESEVNFFAGIPSNRLRFHWNVTFRSGGTVANPVNSKNGLIATERYTSVSRHKDPEKLQTVISIEPAKRLRVGPLSEDFNPMFYFDDNAGRIDKFFASIADNAENPKLSDWVVSQTGNLVTLRVEAENVYNEYVVDMAAGATLSRYRAGDTDGDEAYDWQYESKDGVWIPITWKCVKHERWRSENNRRVPTKEVRTITRIVRWEVSRLNEPIADEEFSIDKLGIKDGEWVTDRINRPGFSYRAPPEKTTE